jgi:hypothetical protein
MGSFHGKTTISRAISQVKRRCCAIATPLWYGTLSAFVPSVTARGDLEHCVSPVSGSKREVSNEENLRSTERNRGREQTFRRQLVITLIPLPPKGIARVNVSETLCSVRGQRPERSDKRLAAYAPDPFRVERLRNRVAARFLLGIRRESNARGYPFFRSNSRMKLTSDSTAASGTAL